ncbi:hypothetical protein CEE36_11455 [candidate division TA06 bacterium B3_TA06]|uniref:Type II toxin-antitoxin system HicA family toxin n=1 Tax=candidate division TA06 bacterium B3_TA06 TaxID=2012487 RepID=A0A532UNR9_UNCT6|nr:MAG: hypothetical protein CEE36_11455 [candidate division TA06 bacterium B3_TA06]
MATQRPKGQDIISSLKTLGFSVSSEESNMTILTMGEHELSIPHGSLTDQSETELRRKLNPIFTKHESKISASSDKTLQWVRDWLREFSR